MFDSGLDKKSRLLNEVVNLLLHLCLQDIVPLHSLTKTTPEWIFHSPALMRLIVRDESKEVKNVTYFVIHHTETSPSIICTESGRECMSRIARTLENCTEKRKEFNGYGHPWLSWRSRK